MLLLKKSEYQVDKYYGIFSCLLKSMKITLQQNMKTTFHNSYEVQ